MHQSLAGACAPPFHGAHADREVRRRRDTSFVLSPVVDRGSFSDEPGPSRWKTLSLSPLPPPNLGIPFETDSRTRVLLLCSSNQTGELLSRNEPVLATITSLLVHCSTLSIPFKLKCPSFDRTPSVLFRSRGLVSIRSTKNAFRERYASLYVGTNYARLRI